MHISPSCPVLQAHLLFSYMGTNAVQLEHGTCPWIHGQYLSEHSVNITSVYTVTQTITVNACACDNPAWEPDLR